MGLIRALVGGLIGGAVGAGIWAAIAYFANYELGIIAWVVGGLVGFGVGAGAGQSASMLTGVLAAVLALGSVAGGKYWAVHAAVGKATKQVVSILQITEDRAKMYMANSLISEYEGQGKTLVWAAGKSKDSTDKKPEDYPKDLWEDVSKRWAAMSPADQENYRRSVEDLFKASMDQFAASYEQKKFFDSFTLFDALWAFLAVGTAFRLGAGGIGDGESDD